MAVPYTFGTATAAIPLSQLDTNFATAITIGNTAVQLGNTVTTLNNMTLANVTISSGNVTITNVSVTTANVSGTANVQTLVITANASVDGNVTLSGGTANGVAYLNGSKAVTSGSALTFDGTNFATTGTASATKMIPTGGSATGNGMYLPASNTLAWSNNGSETMRLDSAGNLGLGVTPSAWQSGIKAITVSGANIYSGQSGAETGLTTNAYYNAGWSRISTGYATLYQQYNGGHFWFNAGSGTGAISFTQAMTLDSSGNLLVGATAAISGNSERLGVTASGASQPAILAKNVSGANDYTIPVWNATTTGDAKFIGFFTEASATLRGSITYNRGGGLTAYNVTSDYRAKTVNGPVVNALEKLASLKPTTGRMNGAEFDIDFFVAHELQEVVPSAVTGEKDAVNEDGTPNYQMVDKSALIPLLTAAIQEQQSIIQSLTDRISALEQK